MTDDAIAELQAEGLSEGAARALVVIGNFSPTVDVLERCVKGYGEWGNYPASKVYLTSSDHRTLAVGLIEAAVWLDGRAEGSVSDF